MWNMSLRARLLKTFAVLEFYCALEFSKGEECTQQYLSTRTSLPEVPIKASIPLITLWEMLPQANIRTVCILRDQMMLGERALEDAEDWILKVPQEV